MIYCDLNQKKNAMIWNQGTDFDGDSVIFSRRSKNLVKTVVPFKMSDFRNGKRFVMRNEPENSLQKVFQPVSTLMEVFGIESGTESNSSEGSKLIHFLHKLPKFLIRSLIVLIIIYQITLMIIIPDKKVQTASLCITFLLTAVYVSMNLSNNKLDWIIKSLSYVHASLDLHADSKGIHRSIALHFLAMFALAIIHNSIQLFLGDRVGIEQVLQNATAFANSSFISPTALAHFLNVVYSVYWIVCITHAILFCVVYSFACEHVELCFRAVADRLKSHRDVETSCKRLIGLFEDASDVLTRIDDAFCFAAFATVLSCMWFMFWSGYTFAFVKSNYLNLVSRSFIGLVNFCIASKILLSASAATESAALARESLYCLPSLLPSRYHELDLLLRRNYKQKNQLTLWRVYVIERSLIFSALGTLFTYGILVATLGNTQNTC